MLPLLSTGLTVVLSLSAALVPVAGALPQPLMNNPAGQLSPASTADLVGDVAGNVPASNVPASNVPASNVPTSSSPADTIVNPNNVSNDIAGSKEVINAINSKEVASSKDVVSGVTNSVTNGVTDDVTGLADDITNNETVGGITDTLSDTTDAVKDTTNAVTDTLSDTTGAVTDTLGDTLDDTTGTVGDTASKVLDTAVGATSSSVSVPTSSNLATSSGTACNNSPDLCSQTYNNITHMGAHNSAFVRSGDQANNVAGNQYYDAVAALDAGLRLLQVQVHTDSTGLRMCHTLCSLYDAGLLSDWLGTIKTWMDSNSNEVVTLLLVNSDDADVAKFGAAFETSGIQTYGYTPTAANATSDWPTLQDMISANTRLVSFVTNVVASDTYSYIMPEFDYMFETGYEITSATSFNCTLDRPGRLESATNAIGSNYMGLVNHMLGQTITGSIYIPNVDAIDTTNSADTSTVGALGTHISQCIQEWGIKPQFVLVDFWDKGDVMAVADSSNGLTSDSVAGRTAPSGDSGSAAGKQGAWVATWALVLVAGVMASF